MDKRTQDGALRPYDAVLVLSYGGPNGQEEVIPFLRDVTAGTNVPVERLAQVGEHYKLFDGRSPINAENLKLIEQLRGELGARGIAIPILFGNVHWYPRTIDTMRSALEFGARRILVLITAAYASYAGSRKYREHLAVVREQLRGEASTADAAAELSFDILRPFFNDAGFIEANMNSIRTAIESLGAGGDEPVHIAFVTHSIPCSMNDASGATGPTYLEQHQLVQRLLEERILAERPATSFSLSFCSRSGPPQMPWLEPDISDRLDQLNASGVRRVVLAPIGFISDHMEVVYDLDTLAAGHARELNLTVSRAATVGSRPEFVGAIVDLMIERAARTRGEQVRASVLGDLVAFPDEAPPDSCRRSPDAITGIPVLAGESD